MTPKEVVVIDRTFQKAMRLDSDLHSADALSGYIAQGTPRRVLETMAVHLTTSRQRAFTWTGSLYTHYLYLLSPHCQRQIALYHACLAGFLALALLAERGFSKSSQAR